ncbi:hypothetical protein GOHSU_04_01630 [Gordonia hirsuta DSM 44140 = NBRC 16056]|uniref:Uncharacterized protein n=1 Tax=Gordonia hirsuta DSM 44140 = NBRC 16056 TaxID=1121927 RepID=L7L5S2_9ACTN|nr:hypothetical protein [Gordonia hirsuta]GAC56294.1 hypothetical protein GOHSU_04_01630 [Gordonia hirsuta DSM 44140 = NBRC 16056]
MAETTEELGARLLEAQIAFELSQLTDDDALAALIDDEIGHFLTESGTIPLEVVMPRALIKDVARKYTMQFPVEGAIPELVGQVAARLYRHPVHERTRLSDVVETRRFDELAAIATGLPLTRRTVDQVLESPATTDTLVEVVQRAVENRFGTKTARRLARPVEKWTRRGAVFVLESAQEDADDLIIDTVRDFWRSRADGRVSSFRDTVSEVDVEDTVVLIFEFWRTFRQTDYFRALLDEAIDEVFDTYGATPIADVIEDLGIGEADLREEGMRFGPPVIRRLDQQGILAAIVRRRLEPFYASPQFRTAVQS